MMQFARLEALDRMPFSLLAGGTTSIMQSDPCQTLFDKWVKAADRAEKLRHLLRRKPPLL